MSILHQQQGQGTDGAGGAVGFDVNQLAGGAHRAAAAVVGEGGGDVKVVVVGFGGHSQSFTGCVVIGCVVKTRQAACC